MPDDQKRVFKSTADLWPADIPSLYDGFNSPIAELDCGRKWAPHNPSGKPFCCDICQAVPAAYKSEWKYLEQSTRFAWQIVRHRWRGKAETSAETTPEDVARIRADTPKGMVLLACLGPSQCQREFRALSCRQFPFFPYVTSDYRFIGLAYEQHYEPVCWVISNLAQVTQRYRDEFVRTYDGLSALFQEEFEQYAYHSELMRAEFLKRKRRFRLLNRDGGYYLVSANRERLERVEADRLPRFGVYGTGKT